MRNLWRGTALAAAVAVTLAAVSCAGGAGRRIEIDATDELRFEPAEVSVTTGETVTFVIANTGKIDHEFILGDEASQGEHGAAHGGDTSGAGTLAEVEVAPGATEETTVTFEEAGQLIYGCHEPGHYEGGMLGRVTVS